MGCRRMRLVGEQWCLARWMGREERATGSLGDVRIVASMRARWCYLFVACLVLRKAN